MHGASYNLLVEYLGVCVHSECVCVCVKVMMVFAHLPIAVSFCTIRVAFL